MTAFDRAFVLLKDDRCEECEGRIPNGEVYGCERCGRDFCEECLMSDQYGHTGYRGEIDNTHPMYDHLDGAHCGECASEIAEEVDDEAQYAVDEAEMDDEIQIEELPDEEKKLHYANKISEILGISPPNPFSEESFADFTDKWASEDAFDRAWLILKMPFVPGSVREGELDEADDEWEERQQYEADFYDPEDDRTRTINIRPDWRRKPEPKEEGRSLRGIFGGGAPQSGRSATALIDLDEDELREPEKLFGRDQQIPFAYLHNKRSLDRLFVPEHMRRRGMGSGLVDALDEWKTKFVGDRGWPGIRPDSSDMQTEDMFRLWHSRGHSPKTVIPLHSDMGIGDEQYYNATWRKYGGPQWGEEGTDKRPFEEAWAEAHQSGQTVLLAEQEQNALDAACEQKQEEMEEKYGRDMEDMALGDDPIPIHERHLDGHCQCECYEGHPSFEEDEFYDDDPAVARHRAHGTERYPGIWGKRRLNEEIEESGDGEFFD